MLPYCRLQPVSSQRWSRNAVRRGCFSLIFRIDNIDRQTFARTTALSLRGSWSWRNFAWMLNKRRAREKTSLCLLSFPPPPFFFCSPYSLAGQRVFKKLRGKVNLFHTRNIHLSLSLSHSRVYVGRDRFGSSRKRRIIHPRDEVCLS